MTLLEQSAGALEMKLAEDSATASAAAVAAFTSAIGEASAAKAGAVKSAADTKAAAETRAAADAKSATAPGARGEVKTAASAPSVSSTAEARGAGDAAPARSLRTARIRELIHGAEDAKADALGRGAVSSHAMAQGTYLLQLAREAAADGDEARATEKAREARQAFGSASGTSAGAPPAPAPAPAKPPAPPPAPAPAPAPAPVAPKPAVVAAPSAQETKEREAAAKAIVTAQQELAAVVGRGHSDAAVRKARTLIDSAEGWLDRSAFERARSFAEDAYKELRLLPAQPPKPEPKPAAEKPAPPREPAKTEPSAAKGPSPSVAPVIVVSPAGAGASSQRRSAEGFAEEAIRVYRPAPSSAAAPTGWEDPYRKVIRALALRDRVSASASTPAARAALVAGGEKLAEARAAWARNDFRGAAALADAAILELSKVSPSPEGRALPEPPAPAPPGLPGDPGGKAPAAPQTPGSAAPGPESAAAAPGAAAQAPGSAAGTPGAAAPATAAAPDNDAYRKAETAIREAVVLVEVCESEKCADRSLEIHAAGKAAVTSARTALTEKRYEYAVELAAEAKKKLTQALEKPKPAAAAAPAVDPAALKKQKTDADDAIREANVQRQVCDQKKCTGKDIEPWLRAESHLAAASAAYADGDFERAKTKAGEAHRILKAQIDAQAAAAAAAPPPKPAPKGLVLPGDVSNVEIRGNQLVVTPSIQFTTGSAVMTAASRTSLAALARVLIHNKKRVRSISVVGYTDNKGATSTNTAISEKRAKAVADGLVAAGVEPSTVTSKGRGPENPIADNDTAEGRSLNRRVEVRVDLADDGS